MIQMPAWKKEIPHKIFLCVCAGGRRECMELYTQNDAAEERPYINGNGKRKWIKTYF